jgi:hypothetical protein
MKMEIEKPSICANVAELGLHRKVCQIRIVQVLEVLQPNSGRSPAPLEAVQSQARVRVRSKVPSGLIEWFYRPFQHGAADGGTRLYRAIARRRAALFYDGTVARACREMTTYDTGGRFRTLIRHKTALFYDENSVFNKYMSSSVFSAMRFDSNQRYDVRIRTIL